MNTRSAAVAETTWGAGSAAPLWPADVIHVNEDGWVLINRGLAHGVVVGQRLLVVGPSVRTMRNIFATHGDAPAPVALQIRRTYELLEVVYVERECAVAVAARAPIERRPEFYRGPGGELLVWVPLPNDYTYPPADGGAIGPTGSANNDDDDDTGADDAEEDVEAQGDGQVAYDQAVPDEPPERITQEDERWEEALPLNGVSVGDLVVPALPASPARSAYAAAPTSLSASVASTTPIPTPTAYDATTTSTHEDVAAPGAEGTGHGADWMKPLV